MAAEEKWYFTREQLANTPSRKSGYDADKELSCRQQAANFIQDMGQRLLVTQLCINTAIVYMHRFYMFHSFTRFHRNAMAAAALFLAAKVEEQPRKLEHVIKVAQICLHREQPPPDVKSEVYIEQAQELVVNENILLQTLGFDVAIDHPHTHVVRCCHLVRASKDLAQTSYFMASNSLHLTTMCLQYKPTVVACFCIHLACKWSNWEIPQSTEGKPWFWYVDKSVTQELLEQLTEEFLAIFEKCPSRLKKKITSLSSSQNPAILSAFSNEGDKKRNGEGSSSNPTSATGPSFSGIDDMKKKQEYLRHHPEYKKHHIPHHARSEGHSISKSSCMFGPPTRPLPSSHVSGTNSNASGTGSGSVLRSVPSSKPSVVDPGSVLGKPEHLHHRPRRPDEKHSRNHELIPSQYKKYDKVSSGVISDFMPTNVGSNNSNSNNISSNNNNSNINNSCSSRVNVGANSSSFMNVPLSHVQSSSSVYLHQQQLQTQPQVTSQTPIIPLQQGQNVDVLGRIGALEASSNSSIGQSSHVLSSISKHQLLTPQPSQTILPHSSVANTRVKSPLLPAHSKVERSIFSPEKSTPPSEGTKLPHSSSQSPSASSVVTATPHAGTNTTVTTSQPIAVASISSTVLRKKNEITDTISNLTNPKTDETQKPNLLNQYHSALGESVKSETTPKEEKPPDVIRQNEGNISQVTEAIVSVPISSINQSEEPHTKEQKKKKKKHKEHKEKHKDKHKHKHKNREPEPIVITIPKEKLTLPQQVPEQGLLKIKIAKDKIATSISAAPSGLKIKIPKEKIKESRKRDRSEERMPGLPGKFHRPNGTTLQVGMEQAGQH
ncbi:cyclin T isoform X2 [Rhodnius prolixus]|uniref:cyclin T isoform X2 n=1 Tax=Rhodnius prolixus TaxID=13249 RepID=UPI003D18E138